MYKQQPGRDVNKHQPGAKNKNNVEAFKHTKRTSNKQVPIK